MYRNVRCSPVVTNKACTSWSIWPSPGQIDSSSQSRDDQKGDRRILQCESAVPDVVQCLAGQLQGGENASYRVQRNAMAFAEPIRPLHGDPRPTRKFTNG